MIYLLTLISIVSTRTLVFVLGYYFGAKHTATVYTNTLRRVNKVEDKYDREFELNDRNKGFNN